MTDAGELVVSGGGSSRVATDIVFEQMVALRLLQGEAELWQELVARIRGLGLDSLLSWEPGGLAVGVFGAGTAIDRVARRSRELADGLAEAAENYGRLEDGLNGSLRNLGAGVMYSAGLLARLLGPVLLLSAAGPALGLAATMGLANLARGVPAAALPAGLSTTLQAALRDNPQLLTSPATVAIVRVLASSVDDFALGAAGLPLPVAGLLGDDGLGLLGVESSALGVLVAARAGGLLRETPVRVNRVADSAAGVVAAGTPTTATLARPSPPAGFADLAERIPTATDGGQVRVERYGDPEHPTWVVYIGGTVEWSPTGSTEPWDMTSNIAAVAGQDTGSSRAVLLALEAAGMRAGDPVVPVAHSQGGLVAAELTARGEINTVGLVTFGAPAGQVALPAGVPAIAIEHTDDLIPALGGTAADDDSRLYVRRELYADQPVPADEPLPAHQLIGYRDTARLVDESAEARLVAFRQRLGDRLGTEPGQQSVWHAERVG